MEAAAVLIGAVRTASEPFERIVRDCETQVLRTAYRILGNWADAEDVAQETFLKLHRRGTEFENDAVRNAWLYRVAVNLCLDRVRAVKPAEELTEFRSGEISAESSAIRAQSKEILMAALARLPAKQRAAVVLREIEGLSTAEVAGILGSSEVTVRSQISAALTRLRGILDRGER
ncbi:MAG: RNA polymerase sigma factor [Acidobacteriota bacterium]|nr:RNA polymerase sigma factor [Acidobacteriota bacterium]